MLPTTAIGILLLLATATGRTATDRHAIDAHRSRLLVTVYKSGLLSILAHNHEIEAPISSGSVEMGSSPAVVLRISTAQLRVLDPEVSAETRAEIETTMLGPDVLDPGRYPEIGFVSKQVAEIGKNSWRVEGELTLHGQTHTLTFDVNGANGIYSGSATLRQSDFGITPIRIAGGTVKVKDVVLIHFHILLLDSDRNATACWSDSVLESARRWRC